MSKKEVSSIKRTTKMEMGAGFVQLIEKEDLEGVLADIKLKDVTFDTSKIKEVLNGEQGSVFTTEDLVLRVMELDTGEVYWTLDQYMDYTDIKVTEDENELNK